MSNLMRPSGPLPPRVYWVRRTLLLVVVMVLTAVVWWLVSGSGDAQPEASNTSAAPTGADTIAPRNDQDGAGHQRGSI
ncbi:MAG: hypothetical protein H0T17_07955, partial [Propionibacteriales bacterium]|nr:hypothetical protein [Propionibacteriales bacterium]